MLCLFCLLAVSVSSYDMLYAVVTKSPDVDLYYRLNECVKINDHYVKLTKYTDNYMFKDSSTLSCDALLPEGAIKIDRYDDGISLYSGEYKMLRYDFGKPEPSDESLIQITAYKKLGCVDSGEEYFDIKFDGYLVQINKGKDVTICGSEAHDFDYRYLPGAPSGGAVYTVQVESSASNAYAVLLTAFFLALLM